MPTASMQNVLIAGSKGQLGADGLGVFTGVSGLSGIDLPEVDLSHRGACFAVLDRDDRQLRGLYGGGRLRNG